MIIKNGKKAYAMAMFLLVMVVITVAISGLAMATKSSIDSSRQARYRAEARMLATSALESFYAKMTESTSSQDLFIKALKQSSLRNAYFPGWVDGNAGTGASINDTGNWVNCVTPTGGSAPKENCVKLEVKVSQGSADVPLLLLITADVQAGCLGNKVKCVTASFQQRLRKPQFYDYMQLNTNMIIDPNDALLGGTYSSDNCENLSFATYSTKCKDLIPAYRWSDTYTGPVYLGDSKLLICPSIGSSIPTPTRSLPYFSSVEITGNGGSSWTSANDYRGDTGCASESSVASSIPVTRVSALNFPTTTDIANSISSAGSNAYQINAPSGNVSLNLTPAGVNWTSSTGSGSVPGNSVIRVNGGATTNLNSNCKSYSSLTIITDGDIVIDCDITLNDQATSSLALISVSGSVVIKQVANDTDTRVINAVLISINKSVYVDSWNSRMYVYGGNEPKLSITGTIAGRFQGVFGSYDSLSGTLSGGYKKDFKWDVRFRDPDLARNLFPWLPRPITTDWRRLDLTEVKVTN